MSSLQSKDRIAAHIADGDRARSQQEWRSAAAAYYDALQLDPTLDHIWVQYGHAVKEQGQVRKAEQAYRQSLAIRPAADTYLQLGHVLKMQRLVADAAESYLAALELDTKLLDGWEELFALGWPIERIQARLAEGGISLAAMFADPQASAARLAVDASDLFYHFVNRGPLLTGIQRVQRCIIEGLSQCLGGDGPPLLLCFVAARREWVEVPFSLYSSLCEAWNERSAWDAIVGRLRFQLTAGPRHPFQQHAVLLNLGTSWWLPNYLLSVRTARRQYGIRFFHFVHDLIPVVRPEFCAPALIKEFLPWIVELLTHADGIFTNSNATKYDLKRVAQRVHFDLPPTEVVLLNGPHQGDGGGPLRPRSLLQMGIFGEFVLFVSTLEARKNHALVLNAWRRLVRDNGTSTAPQLVCVGQRGGRFTGVAEELGAGTELYGAVRLLEDVTDVELATLYRSCLLTIYPSAYEGWGLPVSEALSYGKLALVGKTSSMPEVGGAFVEYFDLADAADFECRLRGFLDDRAQLRHRQETISAGYKYRTWQEISAQILSSANQWSASRPAIGPATLPIGDYLPMRADHSMELGDLIAGSGAFRLGRGWGRRDEFGCLIADAHADLEWAPHDKSVFLHIVMENVAEIPLLITVTSVLGDCLWSDVLDPHQYGCAGMLIESQIEGLRISAAATPDAGSNRGTPRGVRVLGLFACGEDDAYRRRSFRDAFAAAGPAQLTRFTRRLADPHGTDASGPGVLEASGLGTLGAAMPAGGNLSD